MSGKYRFRLISPHFYLWPENCRENKPFWYSWWFRWYICDEKLFKIDAQDFDYIAFSQLYYQGIARNDTTFDQGTLHVFSEYSLKCKIVSTRREENIPENLVGYLTPEGAITPTPIQFRRWEEGDEDMPCDPDFRYRIYGYEMEGSIIPFDLWGFAPHEWSTMAKQLRCSLYGSENGVMDDIESTVYVLSELNLDRLNDTTQCFIPASGQQMEFVFRYSDGLGFTEDSYVFFIVRDGGYNWVYSTYVPLGDFREDPNGNDYGIPYPPSFQTIGVSWDGRNNQNVNDPGHLADPALGPYQAYVYVQDPAGDIVSNIEFFTVVPWIDSILLTHTPSFPPPEPGEDVSIYSVIRGKIDDSGDPSRDYRYYKPDGEPENELWFWENIWDNNHYMFWDLYSERHRKYYENNDAIRLDLVPWDRQSFGELAFRWFIIHDYRVYGPGENYITYDASVVDTTEQWGNEWKAVIQAPENWRMPDLMPYMRLLVYNEVINSKNRYVIQADTSTRERRAHKVIFVEDTGAGGLDIVDWAISHIGVPFQMIDQTSRFPYEFLDCSGFVTSVKIQDIGANENLHYRICWIDGIDYLRGYYYYNDRISTNTEIVDPFSDPNIGRGYLVSIKWRVDDDYHLLNAHMGIIFDFEYDYEQDRIRTCLVISSRGGSGPLKGRVRLDDFLSEYPQDRWDYTFLRWTD